MKIGKIICATVAVIGLLVLLAGAAMFENSDQGLVSMIAGLAAFGAGVIGLNRIERKEK